MPFDESRSDSPDGNHHATLTFAGEIRFGPCYFTLQMDHRNFGERLFGQCVLWSPDSSIACLQEWHTIDYGVGPITSLLLVRPRDWTYFAFPQIRKGFASPNTFIDDSLVLRHSERQNNTTVDRETDLSQIEAWLPLQ